MILSMGRNVLRSAPKTYSLAHAARFIFKPRFRNGATLVFRTFVAQQLFAGVSPDKLHVYIFHTHSRELVFFIGLFNVLKRATRIQNWYTDIN